jgi:hypothetical protein
MWDPGFLNICRNEGAERKESEGQKKQPWKTNEYNGE